MTDGLSKYTHDLIKPTSLNYEKTKLDCSYNLNFFHWLTQTAHIFQKHKINCTQHHHTRLSELVYLLQQTTNVLINLKIDHSLITDRIFDGLLKQQKIPIRQHQMYCDKTIPTESKILHIEYNNKFIKEHWRDAEPFCASPWNGMLFQNTDACPRVQKFKKSGAPAQHQLDSKRTMVPANWVRHFSYNKHWYLKCAF